MILSADQRCATLSQWSPKSSNDLIGNGLIHAVAQSPGRLIDLLGMLSLSFKGGH
jgi:hypothetical protein